ncbi:alpha/beta hydrolase [Phreatobacter stygius]|uniref:alpha/beta hydrolase n=1 Tax=Phreatobacter stygius TaxID=1940610 RepID=UPI0014774879|nr:alpha/beta hydrolase [Phreatobacter stygius]
MQQAGPAMKGLVTVAVVLGLGYAALCATMWGLQRRLLYFPDGQVAAPAQLGLSAQIIDRTADDGVAVRMWWMAPRGSKPVVIHMHGNGGNLSYWGPVFRDLTAAGYGVLALSYRGYGGSPGSPSETGLIADGRTAYATVRELAPAARIVLFGDSLGTGVATALAAERPIAALVLNAPFTAVADRAAELFWFLPVRWLIADSFLSRERIGKVEAPILIVHGDRDATMPIEHGLRLFALAPEPKRFARIAGGSHNDLWSQGGRGAVLAFLEATVP